MQNYMEQKKAKIRLALIPEENRPQLTRIRNDNKSPEDDTFEVVLINHIDEAINHVFIVG